MTCQKKKNKMRNQYARYCRERYNDPFFTKRGNLRGNHVNKYTAQADYFFALSNPPKIYANVYERYVAEGNEWDYDEYILQTEEKQYIKKWLNKK